MARKGQPDESAQADPSQASKLQIRSEPKCRVRLAQLDDHAGSTSSRFPFDSEGPLHALEPNDIPYNEELFASIAPG